MKQQLQIKNDLKTMQEMGFSEEEIEYLLFLKRKTKNKRARF